jgi:hypothetical protein
MDKKMQKKITLPSEMRSKLERLAQKDQKK